MRNSLQDPELLRITKKIFHILLIVCWSSLALGVLYFGFTGKLVTTFLLLSITPVRYILYDVSSDKLTKRPPAFDRSIPLNIFIRFYNRVFPVPNGDFFATVFGLLLALGRAFIDGYGLLIFETFSSFYKVKNDEMGVPLDSNIVILHDSKRLERLKQRIRDSQDPIEAQKIKKIYEGWEDVNVTNDLTQWDFPLRRYLYKPSYYFKNKEVNSSVMDDQYALDLKAYNKAHPDQAIMLPEKQNDENNVKNRIEEQKKQLAQDENTVNVPEENNSKNTETFEAK